MDQIKIGKFIAEMRKEQNLTQIDLAERLGVSNKTISKWECGNGMPDYALMENLCEILKINVNELLSGERLPEKDYNKKAEENMMSLIQESSESKTSVAKGIFLGTLGVVGLLFVVVLMIISWGGVVAISYFIDVPTAFYIILASFLILAMSGMWKDFWRAFKIAWEKQTITNVSQIKKCMLAIKTEIIALAMSGMVMTAISFVEFLRRLSDPEMIGPFLAMAFLSIFYGLLFCLCLLPIYMILKKKTIEE